MSTLSTITCAILRINPLGPAPARKWLIARGVTGTVGILTFFYAISTLYLSEAVVISFTNPVFTAIFAALFLKEAIDRWDIIGGK
jgi:drug/metabolite transporter (DMT)-like permease